MEKNQQIQLTICVKPNLMIDKDYFIWLAVIEDIPRNTIGTPSPNLPWKFTLHIPRNS